MIASWEGSNERAYVIESLRATAKRVPNIDSAIVEIARFSAEKTCRRGRSMSSVTFMVG